MLRQYASFLLFVVASHAAVVRFDIEMRRDILGGQSFGKSGGYELIRGRAYFAVDPQSPRNKGITDIQVAPTNANGKVEYSADIVLLRPKNPNMGNGTLLVEAPNRGGMGALSMYNRAKASPNPVDPEHFGDGYLMREGYSIAWIGWQHDVPERKDIIGVQVPRAVGQEGLVRGEITPSTPIQRFSLGDGGHRPYTVSSLESLVLTVRDGIYGKRSVLSASEWRLENTDILLSKPATVGRIYEFVYKSKDPAVAGLGLAALRDFVSEWKYGDRGVLGESGNREGRFSIGVGTSQSAMALKAMLYEGFNADENGRKVFDGLQPHVAGGRRATFERFTQPSRTSGPYRNASLSTTDQFPYSDAEDTEPVTRRKDSILAKAILAGVVPKIIYTNSSYEYWGSAGSLVHTSLDGKRDLALPESTRVYLLAGGQHGPAAFPPRRGDGVNLANWNDYRWAVRATLRNLREWVVNGTEPPPSMYPKVSSGNLVKGNPVAYAVQYLDFGPGYSSRGISANQPPRVGASYMVLVPKPDINGMDSVGIKMPWVSVPLGAFTGWNFRTAAIGAAGALLANTGSYLPFPQEKIKGQFKGRADYLSRIEEAARLMIQQRLLLEEDFHDVVQIGGRSWDWTLSLQAGQ